MAASGKEGMRLARAAPVGYATYGRVSADIRQQCHVGSVELLCRRNGYPAERERVRFGVNLPESFKQ